MTPVPDELRRKAEECIAEQVKAFNLSFAAPSLHAMLLECYLTAYLAAKREDAEICKIYAHSGKLSMMRRQVAYACQLRILRSTGLESSDA